VLNKSIKFPLLDAFYILVIIVIFVILIKIIIIIITTTTITTAVASVIIINFLTNFTFLPLYYILNKNFSSKFINK
jgi:hypothetical protein